MPNEDKKPAFKFLAIAVSAVLVAALAATGIVAYGQNNTGNMTMFDQTNATNTASSNMTDTTANETDTTATNDTSEEETFTASAVADSECSSVITVDDGTVSLNSTTTMTAEELSDGTMTAGLNDTEIASLDQLIENACSAIREGKSVTALGHLQTARDILSEASGTETAEAGDEGEVEDENEAGDDFEDLEAEDLEAGGNETVENSTKVQ
jgi:cytoskeletal protein RodZ